MDHLATAVLSRTTGPGATVELTYDLGEGVAGPRTGTAVLDSGEVDRLLALADTDYYADNPRSGPDQLRARHEQLGRDLFRLLDTTQGWLSGFLADYGGTWTTVVLGITASDGTGHLPWELLHDGNGYLVARPDPVVPVRLLPLGAVAGVPAARPLRVMFMASAPADEARPLDHDIEEAMIEGAADEASVNVEIDYEESGDLDELGHWLGRHVRYHYDVVHLSAHGDRTAGGPVLITVGPDGGPVESGAAALHGALRESRPRMLVLSGCRSAESGHQGATLSLAEELARTSADTVVGWSRPIDDALASRATQSLYRQLMRGRSPAAALAAAIQRMLTDGAADWHRLRMIARGAPAGPLVTVPDEMIGAGAYFDRRRRTEPFGLDKVDLAGFVDRARSSKILQKYVDPRRHSDKLGIVVHGIGGIGKSSVVSKALARVGRPTPVWVPVGCSRGLDRDRLLEAIRGEPELGSLLGDVDARADLVPALTALLRHEQVRPVVFVLDNLESTVRPDGTDVLLDPAAARVLADLIAAVEASHRTHRIVVTSRYLPQVGGIERLADLHVGPLAPEFQDRMIQRHNRGRNLPDATAAMIRDLAADNTRLLTSLLALGRDAPELPADLLRARLRDRREEFYADDLMVHDLLDRLGEQEVALLRALGPFQVPVSAAVLARLVDPTVREVPRVPALVVRESAERAGRLAAWTLLDRIVGPDGADRYRVPVVVEPALRVPDPVAAAAVAAAALSAELGAFDEALDPRRLDLDLVRELLRLAMTARHADLVARAARALAGAAGFTYRYAEAAETCQRALEVVSHPVLYAELGNARAELGDAEAATAYLRTAVGQLNGAAQRDRARVLAQVTFWAQFFDPDEALGHGEVALAAARAAGARATEADCLRLIAGHHARSGDTARAREYFTQATGIAAELPDGEFLEGLITMDRAEIDVLESRPDVAVMDLERLLAFYTERRLEVHQGAVHLRLANAWAWQNEPHRALVAAGRARDLTAQHSWRRGEFDAVKFISQLQAGMGRGPDADPAAAVAAREAAARARGLADEIGWPYLRREALRNQVMVLRQLGARPEADAVESELARIDPGSLSERIGWLLQTAEQDHQDSRHAEALEAAAAALSLVGAVPAPRQEIRALRVLAEIGDQTGAAAPELEPRLHRLRDLYVELHPELVALVDVWLGRLLIREARGSEALEHLRRALDGYRDQGNDSWMAYVLEVTSTVADRPLSARVRDLATAVSIRHRCEEDAATAVTLRELAVVLPGGVRTTLLRGALVLAESQGDHAQAATVLDDLAAAISGEEGTSGDEGAHLARRAALVRRRGEPLTLAVGPDLVEVLDPDQGSTLLTDLAGCRATLAAEGVALPFVRILDDPQLATTAFEVFRWGERVAAGTQEIPSGPVTTAGRATAVGALVEAVIRVARADPALLSPPTPVTRPLDADGQTAVDLAVRLAMELAENPPDDPAPTSRRWWQR